MIVNTISGSRYEISEDRICTKYNPEGRRVDAFKLYVMKAIPMDAASLGEIWDTPNSDPEVGKLLYVGGKDGWWLSTEVVSIEKDEPTNDI